MYLGTVGGEELWLIFELGLRNIGKHYSPHIKHAFVKNGGYRRHTTSCRRLHPVRARLPRRSVCSQLELWRRNSSWSRARYKDRPSSPRRSRKAARPARRFSAMLEFHAEHPDIPTSPFPTRHGRHWGMDVRLVRIINLPGGINAQVPVQKRQEGNPVGDDIGSRVSCTALLKHADPVPPQLGLSREEKLIPAAARNQRATRWLTGGRLPVHRELAQLRGTHAAQIFLEQAPRNLLAGDQTPGLKCLVLRV